MKELSLVHRISSCHWNVYTTFDTYVYQLLESIIHSTVHACINSSLIQLAFISTATRFRFVQKISDVNEIILVKDRYKIECPNNTFCGDDGGGDEG